MRGERRPEISGYRLVWRSYDGHDSEIYAWTPASSPVQITSGEGQDYRPQVFGNRIVWACAVSARDLDGSHMSSEIFTAAPVPAFSDVAASDPYNEAITRMRAVGIIDGCRGNRRALRCVEMDVVCR